MLMALRWRCSHCGEVVESSADPSAGEVQEYVEDCQVCCRANRLRVVIESEGARAEASPEP